MDSQKVIGLGLTATFVALAFATVAVAQNPIPQGGGVAQSTAETNSRIKSSRGSGYLAGIRHQITRTSTVPGNGDLNPYAIVVAPVSTGKIQKGDVLVTNFNNKKNFQGTGTTIVVYSPSSKKTSVFVDLPQQVPQCPGGVGLGTAMTMLKSGWVIVGSTPSTDGTTKTKGPGCLLVLDPAGRLVATWTGSDINDPWGNMAVVDRGSAATLFISMAGFDVPGPDTIDPKTKAPVVVEKATVLRLELTIPPGKPPIIKSRVVVANGFGQRADKDAFLIGPTGLALGPDNTLYVSDALGNRITAIPKATTRTGSAGAGKTITVGGYLKRPLAMAITPEGHLLVTNALDGEVVEIDPKSGRQLGTRWIDNDQAQSPPGNGDLFGIAMAPDGGFYYVEDDVNTLVEATR
ncbi:MAG: hypothetical protein ACRECV_18375 [Xanthobacteraceae bacterium]